MNQYERLVKWYKRVTWFGILVNLLFVFPLVFAPRTILNLLALDVQPVLGLAALASSCLSCAFSISPRAST